VGSLGEEKWVLGSAGDGELASWWTVWSIKGQGGPGRKGSIGDGTKKLGEEGFYIFGDPT